MGFPKARCENALRKTGGVQLALDELLSGVLVDSSLQVLETTILPFFEASSRVEHVAAARARLIILLSHAWPLLLA